MILTDHELSEINKAVEGLRHHARGKTCKGCPYGAMDGYCDLEVCEEAADIIEILRDRVEDGQDTKAILLELQELQEAKVYWIEEPGKRCWPEAIFHLPDGYFDCSGTSKEILTIPLVRMENGCAPVIAKLNTGYNGSWRAWSAQPTRAQTEAETWII